MTAELEHTSFPVKNYGSYTFPAGDYEALRIVIGEGNGHNWWCVMYPNMCFLISVLLYFSFQPASPDTDSATKNISF